MKRAFYDWLHLEETYGQHVHSGDTVLEIGSSTVERTRELASQCGKLIGVEYSKERLPDNWDNVEYRLGDWQKLSECVEVESIDIAISSHVIEHVPDDVAAVNELYRVLKPGGMAIINTPNRKRLVRALVELFTGERKFPYWEHIREYTENDLLCLLAQSRFVEYSITPIVLGIHNGFCRLYLKTPPRGLRCFANYWEIVLHKPLPS